MGCKTLGSVKKGSVQGLFLYLLGQISFRVDGTATFAGAMLRVLIYFCTLPIYRETILRANYGSKKCTHDFD